MAMEVVSLMLLLAMTCRSNAAIYCSCKDGVTQSSLEKALEFACEARVDCLAILQNGACSKKPNDALKTMCDHAVNSYFQITGSCDFNGAATTSRTSPPMPPACVSKSPEVITGTGTGPAPQPLSIYMWPGIIPVEEPETSAAAALLAKGTFNSVLFWLTGGLLIFL